MLVAVEANGGGRVEVDVDVVGLGVECVETVVEIEMVASFVVVLAVVGCEALDAVVGALMMEVVGVVVVVGRLVMAFVVGGMVEASIAGASVVAFVVGGFVVEFVGEGAVVVSAKVVLFLSSVGVNAADTPCVVAFAEAVVALSAAEVFTAGEGTSVDDAVMFCAAALETGFSDTDTLGSDVVVSFKAGVWSPSVFSAAEMFPAGVLVWGGITSSPSGSNSGGDPT